MRAGEFGVRDDRDARRDATEEGVGGDEPAQRPLPRLPRGHTAAHRVATAARHVHRGGDRAGQRVGEGELPVRRPAAEPAVPRHQQLVRLGARRTAALVHGRDAVAAPAHGELLLVAVGIRHRQVRGGPADREAEQEAVDDDAAGGDVEPVGLGAHTGRRRDMAEAEMQGAVRDRPGPLDGVGPALGVDVQHAVGVDAHESVVRRLLAVLLTAGAEPDGGQRAIGPHEPHPLGERLSGQVLLLGRLLTTRTAHGAASFPRGALPLARDVRTVSPAVLTVPPDALTAAPPPDAACRGPPPPGTRRAGRGCRPRPRR